MFISDEGYLGGGPEGGKLTYTKPRSTAVTVDAFILLVCLKSGEVWGVGYSWEEKKLVVLRSNQRFQSIHHLIYFPSDPSDHLILVFVPAPSAIPPYLCISPHFNFIYPLTVALCIPAIRTCRSLQTQHAFSSPLSALCATIIE